jgi:hypothetical protein
MRLPAPWPFLLPLAVALSPLGSACGGGASALQDDAGVDALGPQDDAAPPQDDAAPAACPLPPRKFWTWNTGVMPPADVQVQATCRAMTAHAYVFVADAVWDHPVTQAMVDTVVAALEVATPSDPTRGIIATDLETYGDPPDVDGDPRIYLVYFDIKGFGSYSFDGFFRNSDQTQSSVSNKAEMLHLNATGASAPDSDYMLGVVIHELVHLIGWRYDTGEEQWLSEALAESAMSLAGYTTDVAAAAAYARHTATTPLVVRDGADYGAVFLFGAYLGERFGPGLLRALLQDPAHGVASVEAKLQAEGTTFREVLGDLMVAALLDQPALEDGRYGFEAFDVSALGQEAAAPLDGTTFATDVKAWGGRLLRFTPAGAGTVAITLTSAAPTKLVVRSVVLPPARPDLAGVANHDVTASPTTITLPVAAGEVVDLVVAAYWGSSLATPDAASEKVAFEVAATYTP